MADVVRFFVPGPPKGKARARVVRGHAFTPEATVDAERTVAWEGKKAMAGRAPFAGALRLKVDAVYEFPKSWSKKLRETTYWKTTKFDWDNVAKLASDALNGICWIDDAQVSTAWVTKRYVQGEELEGLHIEIGTLTDEP